jgi:hypothetical protein
LGRPIERNMVLVLLSASLGGEVVFKKTHKENRMSHSRMVRSGNE